MKTEHRDTLLLGLSVTAVLLLAALLLPRPLETTNRALLDAQFRLRGEKPVDSSVVILYFSSDDISILGDLPLKRSYYALLVNALHDAGAAAIGFDIGFGEHNPELREYDDLFTGTVSRAGNVALSGYFRALPAEEPRAQAAATSALPALLDPSPIYPAGVMPELPFPDLLRNAAGLGHTNLTSWYDIPVAIRYGNGAVPAFSLELLRVAHGVGPASIRREGQTLLLPVKGRTLAIPFGPEGEMMINYPGGMRSLPSYSAIAFLQAYDAWKTDPAGSRNPVDVGLMRGKIVLVGIIAEGRSAFVATPFDSQFPTVGLHAMAIHNVIHDMLLRRVPFWAVMTLSAVLGILITTLSLPALQRYRAGGIALLAIALAGGGQMLFSVGHTMLPLALPAAVLIVVPFALLLYRQRSFRRQITRMANDNMSIQQTLREKEALLASLERELGELSEERLAASGRDDNTVERRREELFADVKRFKEEVRQLKLQAEEAQPAAPESGSLEDFHGILYHPAGPMAGVIGLIKMIAASEAPVLILGESGTGKELVARAIHQASPRGGKPFVAVNCGALTETLLDSELFGHEKGAFTGAVKEKPGRFEIADSGTIFLDEVGETSEAFQVKLLRVLQEGTFERVGGVESRHTSVRVIAATNRDVRKAVAERKFREDLFYRLNVFTVTLPPLRERKEDLPYLLDAFVGKEDPAIKMSMGVKETLLGHSWRGNIRELQSAVKRAVIMARAEGRDTIQMKDLSEEFSAAAAPAAGGANIEESILQSLRAKGFSRSAITDTASELGGLNRGTVAEYFRGECFRYFAQHRWDICQAARAIAGTDDPAIYTKAEKKLTEYLTNAVEYVDFSLSLEQVKTLSKPKYKNLAQRYHPILDSIIESFYHKEWQKERTSDGTVER